MSSSKTTGWAKQNAYADTTSGWTIEVWTATATSTGSHTITITPSSSLSAIVGEIDCDSYHSSRGTPTWWTVASGGQHDTAGSTNNLPTLVPSIDAVQGYVGVSEPANGAVAGSTSGYTYDVLDSQWLVMASNVSVTGSQTPNVAQSSSGTATVSAIIFTDTPISGTGGANLKKSSLSGSGTVTTGGVTGTGSINLKKPSLSVAAKETESGTGSINLKKPSLSIAAAEKFIATGSMGLKKPALSVAAKETEAGTGSIGLKKPSLSGIGTVGSSDAGTGSIGLKKPGLLGFNYYRLYPSTDDPAVANVGDNTQYVFGLSFEVTADGLALDGWWHWVASNQDTTAQDFALWIVGVGYVTGSKVTSGTFTAGEWNFVACSTPIPLVNGTEYRAVRSVNKQGTSGGNYYSFTNNYFDTGDGSSGIINGPLLAFSAPSAGTNPEPSSAGQMTFNSGGSDVTADFPTGEFNETNYWLDVQVSTQRISGTGSAGLKKPSLSIAGKETFSGSGSVNLHKPSLSVSAKETETGTGSISLKKPSLSLSAEEIEKATGSVSLKKPSLSGTGTQKGFGGVSLHKMGVSLAGEEFINGTGSVSLKKPVLSVAAEEIEKASGSIRLKKPSLSGTGTQKGFGGVSLKKPALSGSGTVTSLSGNGSINLHKPVLALSGKETISGTGSAGLKKPALSASAVEKEAGTGSVNLHKPSLDASGTEKFIGTGSCGLKKPSLAASGGETISGSGSVSLHKPVIALAAPQPVTGTGSANLKKPVLSASGTEKFIGTGSAGLKKPSVSLSSTEFEAGTGSVHLHKMSISAAGSEKISATGSARLHKMSIHAEGPQNSIGSGGVHLHKMSISADGYEAIEGSGGVRLKKPHIHAAQGSAPIKCNVHVLARLKGGHVAIITKKQRKVLARTGVAMPDGSYYIRNAGELDDAIHAVGRGDASHDVIRKHIIKRAAALNLSDKIPGNWNPDGSLKDAKWYLLSTPVRKDCTGAIDDQRELEILTRVARRSANRQEEVAVRHSMSATSSARHKGMIEELQPGTGAKASGTERPDRIWSWN